MDLDSEHKTIIIINWYIYTVYITIVIQISYIKSVFYNLKNVQKLPKAFYIKINVIQNVVLYLGSGQSLFMFNSINDH